MSKEKMEKDIYVNCLEMQNLMLKATLENKDKIIQNYQEQLRVLSPILYMQFMEDNEYGR